MSHQHKVMPTEIGMVRIYLKPSDKTANRPRAFWPGKPLYANWSRRRSGTAL